MNLILTGVQGVGKSTYGRELALRTDRVFFDTDCYIEQRYLQEFATQLHYKQVYKAVGHAQFRQWERDAVAQVNTLQHAVIATGGGTLLDPDNCKALQTAGKIIYLYLNIFVTLND